MVYWHHGKNAVCVRTTTRVYLLTELGDTYALRAGLYLTLWRRFQYNESGRLTTSGAEL